MSYWLFCLGGAVARGQVNLPAGFEVVEFAVSDVRTDGYMGINNCGQIVYTKGRGDTGEIFLYDNGRITQLTDNDILDGYPDINDAGTIVWCKYGDRIMQLKDGRVTFVGEGYIPRINERGDITWTLYKGQTCHSDQDIFLRQRRDVIRITDDEFNNQSPAMNNAGVVVWGHGNFCVRPQTSEVWMYDDGQITVMPTEETYATGPTINDNGLVAWSTQTGVELWQDGKKSKLEEWTLTPELNNRGDMKLVRQRDYNESWLRRIEDGNAVYYQLSDDIHSNSGGDINDLAEVVWRFVENPPRGDFGGGVRFLRRIRTGDMDGDLHVDLADFGDLVGCLTGPGPFEGLCQCRFGDVDHDGDVDLADVARFQNNFTGN